MMTMMNDLKPVTWLKSKDVTVQHALIVLVCSVLLLLVLLLIPEGWTYTLSLTAVQGWCLLVLCWTAFHATGSTNSHFSKVYAILYIITGADKYKQLGMPAWEKKECPIP